MAQTNDPQPPDAPRSPWLQAVLAKAAQKRWCRRPYCTTCGALDFRHAVVQAAAREAGLRLPRRRAGDPAWRLFSGFDPADQARVEEEIIAGLGQLDEVDCRDEDALLVIARGVLTISPERIEVGLSERPAGFVLAALRARFERRREMAARRAEAHEAREAEDRRRAEIRRRAHARDREAHAERKVANDARIRAALTDFSALGVEARLRFLASDGLDIPLDALPAHQIPHGVSPDVLTRQERQRLIARIDRRSGRWAALRARLEDDGGGASD